MGDRRSGKGSIGDRVAADHRRLEALVRRTRAALAGRGDPRQAVQAFRRLEEAVSGHLLQEDSLYYPSIWALRPEHKDELVTLVRAHDEFRSRLADVTRHLERGAVAQARSSYEKFVDDFDRHEVREEMLLARLERDLTAGG
jgi:hypothetical protein